MPPVNVNLLLIHIGKCGGTTVFRALNRAGLQPTRWHTPSDRANLELPTDTRIVIWVRHPLTRFVSAFNMSKAVMKVDVSNLAVEDVDISNSIAPPAIKKKIRTGHAFSPGYERLIESFASANELAEALTDEDADRRAKARKLMTIPEQNIGRGIGWHLEDGDLVDRHSEQIFFVGRQEATNQDLARLSTALDTPLPTSHHARRNKDSSLDTQLSPKAVRNLMDFYRDTDYRALDALLRHGWISQETAAAYAEFDAAGNLFPG